MRTALITGGSSGIGLSICHALLDSGYRVLNVSRRAAPLEQAELYNYSLDLTDPEATAAIASKLAAEHQVTDIIHNAGVIRPAPLGSVQLSELEELTQIHLGAAIILVKALLPSLKATANGRIVFIGSRASLGMEARTCYAATKLGMVGMARTWALELAADKITVNVVAPGPIAQTEMFHRVVPEGSEKQQQLAAGIPVKRLGEPQDVARAVLFFLAPENSFITGQTLFVCGGSSLGSLAL